MKRLISARDVEEAARAGTCLYVDANTIVTPQARDLARECGVSLECGEVPSASTPPESTSSPASEPALSAEEIEQVIRAALASGVWTEQKLKELMNACEGM